MLFLVFHYAFGQPPEPFVKIYPVPLAVPQLTRAKKRQSRELKRTTSDEATAIFAHRAEQRIWAEAGIEPRDTWYRELGSGMGAALNTAAGMDAYVFADRGTWISFANRRDLELLYAGDPALFNQYGSLRLSAERHPHLKHELAGQWHEWLLSPDGQAAIAGFKLNGEQLFFSNAGKD